MFQHGLSTRWPKCSVPRYCRSAESYAILLVDKFIITNRMREHGHGANHGGSAGAISRVAKVDSPPHGAPVCAFGTMARGQRSKTADRQSGRPLPHSHG